MNLKRIVLAAAAGSSLLAALPAFAHGWQHRQHRPHLHRAPAVVYLPGRTVLVAPPPVIVRAPVYYSPAPAIYAPAPVILGGIPTRPGVRVSFGARL